MTLKLTSTRRMAKWIRNGLSTNHDHVSSVLLLVNNMTTMRNVTSWLNYFWAPSFWKNNERKHNKWLKPTKPIPADFDTLKFDEDKLIAWEALLADSMVSCNTTCDSTDPTKTIHDFVTHITEPTIWQEQEQQCAPVPTLSHPQAMKSIHGTMAPEYLMADQDMLSHSLPQAQPTEQMNTPKISKMIWTFPDCVTQGDSGANHALINDWSILANYKQSLHSFP